jgi:hypothetical protein
MRLSERNLTPRYQYLTLQRASPQSLRIAKLGIRRRTRLQPLPPQTHCLRWAFPNPPRQYHALRGLRASATFLHWGLLQEFPKLKELETCGSVEPPQAFHSPEHLPKLTSVGIFRTAPGVSNLHSSSGPRQRTMRPSASYNLPQVDQHLISRRSIGLGGFPGPIELLRRLGGLISARLARWKYGKFFRPEPSILLPLGQARPSQLERYDTKEVCDCLRCVGILKCVHFK